ncbi:DEAD/DEAH box helicase [Gardnerella sp. KA00243]|uniref:DEAD/DEAH box helicase n=1 Tax=Gardnerella TaxID=2701 RepID=UPI0002633E77|nr:ATP-dependent RNA helicase [Gardnerella vaginalis 6420LIT]EIK78486.1 ATP-dependent RNA helicase [Gardnerella vaginalis 6420B]NSX30830.1 DEAD/DEAH box helicase [Gardnerella vaginalis]RFT30170.1 ATP-dependent helicase [Bifidobacteriaceae bacterium VN003]
MPHTHHAAFAQKRGAKNTKNDKNTNSINNTNNKNSYKTKKPKSAKNTRKSAEKRNPFEYQGSHKNYGSNHEFNSRRERNRKAEKARQKTREKALRYEEVAIADAEQDFAKHNIDKNNVAKHNSAKSHNTKQNSAISLHPTSKKQKQDSHNATIIPDSAIESRENYRDDVTFAQLGVPEPLVEVLRADGKTTAFPIQQATLPDSLQGANILGRGRTGSGKTLAFSIPLVARLAENFVDLIHSDKNRKSRESSDIPAPRAIILAPTRELVHQIDDVIAPLAAAYGMRTVTVYGGVRYQRQVSQLKQGAQIVLACPGRLEDLLRQGALTLEKVMVSVLDEADEMADMGFLPAVTRLLEQVAPDGQRMLFSATLDRQVSTLVERFLPNAVVHAVDDADCQVDTMTHHIFAVSAGDKYEVLRKLASGKKRSIFFTRTKYQAKNMAKKFVQQGIPAVDLQGNLSQNQRDRHLAVFAEGLVRVLVATDVAARGIDISDVALVVQTEPPEDPKSFLHRSGRTARAGEEGDVVTLVLPNQKRAAHMMLRKAGIHAKAEDVNPASLVLDEIVGEAAELQEGWSMPEPEQQKRKGRGRGRGQRSGRGRERDERNGRSSRNEHGELSERNERSGRGKRGERGSRVHHFGR